MIPAERQRTILSLLSHQQVISITELVEQLNVSHMTIRRDIMKLESSGKVISVSGGVQLAQSLHSELSHDAKAEQHANEKALIGNIAAALIPHQATVYLDAGTTSLEVAHQIASRKDILVITNDFAVTNYLISFGKCEIYHTGGKVDRENHSSIGVKVAEFLSDMNIDIAFVSTSSWNLKGLSTPSEDKVSVKQAITRSAKASYLISDSSKYGRVASFHALDLGRLDGVITDAHLPDWVEQEITDKGLRIYTSLP